MLEAIDMQKVHLDESLEDNGYGLHLYGSTNSEIPYFCYMKWFFEDIPRIISDDEYKQECLLGFMRETGYALRITKEYCHYEFVPEIVKVHAWKIETHKVTLLDKIRKFFDRF